MKYYFIGIKGSGMSSLAQILYDLGNEVTGSDIDKFFFTQKPLEERGILIKEFDYENIIELKDYTIIAGNAFNESNLEIKACMENDIKFEWYHEFLQKFVEEHKSIAVSGAHGKTTTTGLLSHVIKSIMPLNYLIGDGTGCGQEGSQHFVFEACEYKRHFLSYKPNYTIVTNIDFDHPDYFSGIEDVKDAFKEFANQTKELIVYCGDDKNTDKLFKKGRKISYGFEEKNDLRAINKKVEKNCTSFEVLYKGKNLGEFKIPIFGDHQILNTLAVIAVCICEKINLNEVKRALLTYEGVKRRFTETIKGNNVLIDDYAHHPTEIKATIDSVKKKYPNKKLISIFQPHTFSRTEAFIEDFSKSFKGSEKVFLVDIFSSAREKEGKVTINDLVEKTENADYINEETIEKLKEYQDSVLLFMGAGDIQKIQKKYEEKSIIK